ncbi:MAG: DASS family sodium-coupled anion symporter [Nitrosomonas sp.]|nr:DASS family sodium-coupled anion symporter [Nitrosomonas sp.]
MLIIGNQLIKVFIMINNFFSVRGIGFVLGPVFLLITLLVSTPEGMPISAWHTAGIAVWLAVWWATQAVPIHVTALLPVVLFPMLGILDFKESTLPYIDPIIFLLLGGFIMSIGISKWNLHRRLSLNVLNIFGNKPAAILAGFMGSTAFISAWISNSAAAIIMISIVTALIGEISRETDKQENFVLCLLLGIAYSASMGGMATIIGSPPNAFIVSYLAKNHGIEISFLQWMAIGVPATIIMTTASWWVLAKWVYPFDSRCIHLAPHVIADELSAMGKLSLPEKRTALIFVLVAVAWIIRDPIQKNLEILPWLTDPIIAMLGAVLIFVTPSGQVQQGYSPLINWKSIGMVPWSILILVGGGLSLSVGIQKSGFATWLGQSLPSFSGLELVFGMVCVITFIVFLTELTSNTATTATLAPILGAFAISNGIDLHLIFLAAVMSVSCAFMLPIATPPNAIIFATGRITIPQMANAGFRLNLVAIFIVTMLSYTLIPLVFD